MCYMHLHVCVVCCRRHSTKVLTQHLLFSLLVSLASCLSVLCCAWSILWSNVKIFIQGISITLELPIYQNLELYYHELLRKANQYILSYCWGSYRVTYCSIYLTIFSTWKGMPIQHHNVISIPALQIFGLQNFTLMKCVKYDHQIWDMAQKFDHTEMG